jgi:hypothetical protein
MAFGYIDKGRRDALLSGSLSDTADFAMLARAAALVLPARARDRLTAMRGSLRVPLAGR